MSGPSTTRRGGDGRWIGGIILVLIGAGLLAGQFVPDIGRYAPLVVGLGLLIIFLFTRNAGRSSAAWYRDRHRGRAAAPGAVPGVGRRLDPALPGPGVPRHLGLRRLLRMPRRAFGPFPGGILTFVGIVALGGLSSDFGQYLWPAVLIFIGLVSIVSSLRRKPVAPSPTPGPAATPVDPTEGSAQPAALELPSDD